LLFDIFRALQRSSGHLPEDMTEWVEGSQGAEGVSIWNTNSCTCRL